MVVGPVTRLLDESRREAVSIGPVVGQLRVDEVVDVPLEEYQSRLLGVHDENRTYSILKGSGPAEDVVLGSPEERLSVLGLLLEVVRGVETLDVLLEGLNL